MNNSIKVLTSIILFVGYGTDSQCAPDVATSANQPAQTGVYNKFVKTAASGNNAITNAATTSIAVKTNNAQNTVVSAGNNKVNNAATAVSTPATATNKIVSNNNVQNTTVSAGNNTMNSTAQQVNPLFDRESDTVNQIAGNIDAHLNIIKEQINKTFSKLYSGTFTKGQYTNKGLIDTISYCLSYIKYKPRINTTPEQYLQELQSVLKETIEYCLHYINQCNKKIGIKQKESTVKQKTTYIADELKILSELIEGFQNYLQLNVLKVALDGAV